MSKLNHRFRQVKMTEKSQFCLHVWSASLTLTLMLGSSTGVPTHNKVMWESSGGQGEPELEGCPSGPAWASTPKPESAYFTALWFHLHLWLYGGLSPTTISLSEKELTYSSS